MNSFLNAWSPRILSVLRIITGFLFLWHGSQKLFSFPPPKNPGPGGAFMTFTGVLEFGGGILILLGLFTRPVAFLLSGTMAVAYFMAHAPEGFRALINDGELRGLLPLVNGGELAVIYCFVFFYFFFAGGGPWSVDALIKKSE